MSLIDDFRAHLPTLGLQAGPALVAVSGGPDSVALLDLLKRSGDLHELELVVGHFDHGIHPESAAVAARTRALAGSYGLPYEEGGGALGPLAGETIARLARYAWLEAARVKVGASVILTAHHADDQAETVLMRLLSGSGPTGLAGMAARKGTVVRPLLPFRRSAILTHVRLAGLSVWTDPANEDPRHLRSWLRAEVMPALRARLPGVDEALLRAARQAADGRAAWETVLDHLPELDLRREPDGFSVAARPLSGYDSALGVMLLMSAARRVGCPLGPTRAGRVFRLARRAASGVAIPLGRGWSAELTFDRLLLSRSEAEPAPLTWSLEGMRGHRAWGRWRLRWSPEAAPDCQERLGLAAWFAPGPLVVRTWAPGERLRPLGGIGRRLVVRCFQDARIPRSRRAGWPVLAGPDGVVWIPGVSRADALLPEPGTEALRVDAEHT